MKILRDTVHTLALPVIIASRHIPHIPGVKKPHVHATLGTGVMFIGVLVAKAPLTGFPHICCDVLGYSLHAVGLAPVLKLIGLDH